MSGPTGLARWYIGGTIVVGGALLAVAVTQLTVAVAEPTSWTIVGLLALLIIVADAAPAILLRPAQGALITASATFPVRMAAILLAGPWGTILATTVSLFVYVKGGRPFTRRAFNVAQLNIAIWLAGFAYRELGGGFGPITGRTFASTLLPFAVGALVYYLVNTGLVTAVVVLTSMARPRDVWRKAFVPFAPTYLGYGPVALLLAILWSRVGAFAALLAVGPILLARWATTQLVAEREVQESALRAFARTVETKDLYTRGHSERVSRLAELMGRRARLPDERVGLLRYAGMLHDIGKIRVPTEVLQKAGPLTREEFAAVQLHPVYGHAMMRDVAFLDDVLPGILHHHERYDGSGYPMGLAGRDIPEFARMIAVADAFDSMTSTRSYRSATPVTEALAEVRRHRGTQFDPAMADLLGAVVDEHGWQPAPPPRLDDEAAAVPAAFDHDDPLRPVQVEDAAAGSAAGSAAGETADPLPEG